MLIGLFIVSGGVIVLSWVTSLYGFLAGMTIVLGFGSALVYIPSLFTSWSSLPSRKGLATGIVSFSFGFGGVVYGLLFTFLINPWNNSPTEEVTMGDQTEHLFSRSIAEHVPDILRWTMVAAAVIGVLASLLIVDKTTKEQRKSMSQSIASNKSLEEKEQQGCPSLRVAMKTSAFWVLFVFCFCAMLFPNYMLVQYKAYATKYFSNDHFLSGIGSIALFVNSLARFTASWLTDYFPYKTLTLIVCVLSCVLAFTVQLIVSYAILYAIWVTLVFACHGCIFAPAALKCGQLYGTVVGSKSFSIISQGANLSNLVLGLTSVYLINNYGYATGFYVTGVGAGMAVCLVLLLKSDYEWGSPEVKEELIRGK